MGVTASSEIADFAFVVPDQKNESVSSIEPAAPVIENQESHEILDGAETSEDEQPRFDQSNDEPYEGEQSLIETSGEDHGQPKSVWQSLVEHIETMKSNREQWEVLKSNAIEMYKMAHENYTKLPLYEEEIIKCVKDEYQDPVFDDELHKLVEDLEAAKILQWNVMWLALQIKQGNKPNDDVLLLGAIVVKSILCVNIGETGPANITLVDFNQANEVENWGEPSELRELRGIVIKILKDKSQERLIEKIRKGTLQLIAKELHRDLQNEKRSVYCITGLKLGDLLVSDERDTEQSIFNRLLYSQSESSAIVTNLEPTSVRALDLFYLHCTETNVAREIPCIAIGQTETDNSDENVQKVTKVTYDLFSLLEQDYDVQQFHKSNIPQLLFSLSQKPLNINNIENIELVIGHCTYVCAAENSKQTILHKKSIRDQFSEWFQCGRQYVPKLSDLIPRISQNTALNATTLAALMLQMAIAANEAGGIRREKIVKIESDSD